MDTSKNFMEVADDPNINTGDNNIVTRVNDDHPPFFCLLDYIYFIFFTGRKNYWILSPS